MDEHSFLEKDGAPDNSMAKRLSESRPLFKPVLVKDILAEHDGDDDDSDDEQIINSDNSDEESIELDGCQPLSDEAGNDVSDEGKENHIENQVFNQPTHQEHPIQHAYHRNSGDYPSESKIAGKSKEVFDKVYDQELAAEHSHYKSAADYAARRTDSYPADFPTDKPLKVSRSSDEMVSASENAYGPIKSQSLYQYAEERKLARDLPQHKHSLQNIVVKQDIEIKEEEHHKKYVVKQKSTEVQQKLTHNNMHASDTPMKHPHLTTRPNPSTSHRNIFQTPQNKAGNEFTKNSLQTPATIFSHSWHKQHMAQTPMQSQLSSRDSVRTPAANSMISQTSRETPRIYGSEHKSVRRPLAETMGSSQAYGPQLPRLQEVPNESQMTPPLTQDTSSASRQGNLSERKSVYKTTISNQEINNRHSSNSDKIRSEANIQQNLSAPDSSHSSNSFDEMKPKTNHHNNAYQSSKKLPRVTDNYNNYPPKESHSSQPVAQTKSSQSEPVPKIQCTVPQKDTRQSKIITVKDRQYLVLGVLGTGMSCQVVRAQDLSTSELRAIKCVNLNKMDREAAEGCLQEICMLDKLKAPCIVHMYDFEIKAPWVHVVMEIGDTDLSRLLKSMLQEKKQIPLTMVLYYWTEMLTAVQHIHKNGVIHSDLKPANFLLVRGRLKLIDFGIASTINSDMTSVVKNSTIGTLNYISPEALLDVNAGNNTNSPTSQCNKYKINHKSDVWSLGCILYGLVYGATPFHHIRQQWAKLSAITDPKHKINYPSDNGTENVPKILIDVMKKCLQREPKARPSVTDLLEVPYLQSNIARPVPQIPSTIIKKIREALTEEEWNTLAEVLVERR
ncbi:serine/threonine-protein kinase mph1 [Trichogramma pretiosum]|uniref:serine/threonine-protein kinase mph1 n=1 Tax=Trichogramma pretiosum TaxID=7493 RepID=UPI0006C99D04|nr:serine/threonine-protein kinase mph1 [Trichogramma pretiosum]